MLIKTHPGELICRHPLLNRHRLPVSKALRSQKFQELSEVVLHHTYLFRNMNLENFPSFEINFQRSVQLHLLYYYAYYFFNFHMAHNVVLVLLHQADHRREHGHAATL